MTSPAVLAAGLRAHAQGLYCLEAAADLLIDKSWLHRSSARRRVPTALPQSSFSFRREVSVFPRQVGTGGSAPSARLGVRWDFR